MNGLVRVRVASAVPVAVPVALVVVSTAVAVSVAAAAARSPAVAMSRLSVAPIIPSIAPRACPGHGDRGVIGILTNDDVALTQVQSVEGRSATICRCRVFEFNVTFNRRSFAVNM